jgi:hypothetical protein
MNVQEFSVIPEFSEKTRQVSCVKFYTCHPVSLQYKAFCFWL